MNRYLCALALILASSNLLAQGSADIEKRIIAYVMENMEPGKRLVVSQLYNEVFTSPEERKVLDKLNRAFFRIPLFIIEHETSQGRLPTLSEIAEQFDFYGPEESRVVLSIIESDPRVPNFIERDPDSGELVSIDIDTVKADKRFNQQVERTLIGWEGKTVPAVSGTSFEGDSYDLAALRGKTVLLYVWFTNCPPCVRISPELAAINDDFKGREFMVLGANADRVLGLSYDDAARAEYVKKHGVNYPNIHLSQEARSALGEVNIFPTLFLINPEGTIVKYYVNYQPRETLSKDIEGVLSAASSEDR